MIKCIVIDDEPLAREGMEILIARSPNLDLCGSFASATDALSTIKRGDIELLFLDIELPGIKGTDFYKLLHPKPQVILTTAYRNYAVEGFELNVVDYLLKPISFERFLQAIQKVRSLSTVETASDFFIKCDGKLERIQKDDIVYIEGMKDYVSIHTVGRRYVPLINLKNIGEKLTCDFLIRIHKSFIININLVTSIEGNTVWLGDKQFPVGAEHKEFFFEILVNKKIVKR